MSTITKPIEETHIEEPTVIDELDELLLKMENYIREHGWIQHAAWKNGRVCLIGALYSVKFGIDSIVKYVTIKDREAKSAMVNEVGDLEVEIVKRINHNCVRHGYSKIDSLPDYNDNVAGSEEDIYNILRIAREK